MRKVFRDAKVTTLRAVFQAIHDAMPKIPAVLRAVSDVGCKTSVYCWFEFAEGRINCGNTHASSSTGQGVHASKEWSPPLKPNMSGEPNVQAHPGAGRFVGEVIRGC
jgi:hypothetical protein